MMSGEGFRPSLKRWTELLHFIAGCPISLWDRFGAGHARRRRFVFFSTGNAYPYFVEKSVRHPGLHTSTHLLHPVHVSGFTRARKFFTSTAPTGHSLTQRIQPIQAVAQAFRASPPLSQLEQRTMACRLTGAREINPLGQAVTHWEQPLHREGSIEATPLHT